MPSSSGNTSPPKTEKLLISREMAPEYSVTSSPFSVSLPSVGRRQIETKRLLPFCTKHDIVRRRADTEDAVRPRQGCSTRRAPPKPKSTASRGLSSLASKSGSGNPRLTLLTADLLSEFTNRCRVNRPVTTSEVILELDTFQETSGRFLLNVPALRSVFE